MIGWSKWNEKLFNMISNEMLLDISVSKKKQKVKQIQYTYECILLHTAVCK